MTIRAVSLSTFVVAMVMLAVGGSGSAAPSLVRNGLIAYDSDVTGPLEVFVMNPDGSKKRRLTHSRQNGQPSWSPDGQRIVFVHGGCSTAGCGGKPSALWVMNADGRGQRRLTSGGNIDNDARWSPDGKLIAFTRGTSCKADGCNLDLWLIRPDGTGEQRLTRDRRSAQPSWSPDGTKIAFSHGSSDGSRWDINVMNADGTGERDVTTRLSGTFDVKGPAWSPDGRTIVFTYSCSGCDDALAFISPDGTHLRHLNAQVPVSEPAWSPDGKSIVFQTQQTLWVIDYATLRKGRRVAFDGDNHNPSWQPLR